MATTLPEVVFDGVPRKLACVPSPASFSGLPKFGAVQPRELDPAEYVEVDNRARFPFVMDQGSHSSCVGHGWAGAYRCVRVLAGMEDVEVSPSFNYAQVNGNRDEGASISEGGVAAHVTGFALMSEVPEDMIFVSQIPKSVYPAARNRRVGTLVHCQTYEQMLSVVMLNGVVVLGFTAGNQTPHLDAEGVAPVIPGQPNHCVFAYGAKRLKNGDMALLGKNSWTIRFGLAGSFYLTRRHFPVMGNADACGLWVAEFDPTNPNNPVPVAA